MADAFGMRFRAYAVETRGECLGVVPLLLRRRGPVSTVNYGPVGCIGPVLRGDALRAGRVRELLRAIEPVLLRERVVVTMWSFPPGVDVGEDELAMPGFKVMPTENLMVPATKLVEDYLKSLAPKQRAAIRRCETRGMRAVESTREEITQWLPEQVSAVHRRQGVVSNYTQTAARSMVEFLADDPRMLWRTIRAENGRVLAMSASIISDDRLWGWLLAGEPIVGASAHVAAYWDAINWSLSRGLACDFGGVPTQGIRNFKIAMGGEVEMCMTAERIRPRVYKTGRAFHGWLMARVARRGVRRR